RSDDVAADAVQDGYRDKPAGPILKMKRRQTEPALAEASEARPDRLLHDGQVLRWCKRPGQVPAFFDAIHLSADSQGGVVQGDLDLQRLDAVPLAGLGTGMVVLLFHCLRR